MGCASSTPLATSGKNLIDTAKESANEFTNKGEHMIQEVGDTAKDGFTTGVGQVKDGLNSALETAGNSIGTAVGKVSDTFTGAKSNIANAAEETAKETDETINKSYDLMVDPVSEAETVAMSEPEKIEGRLKETKENMVDSVEDIADMAFDKVHDIQNDVEELENDSLEIEDMEDAAFLSHDGKIEDDKRKSTPAPSPPPEVEAKKEEPPTFWEARADAILEQRVKSVDVENPASDVDSENTEREKELEHYVQIAIRVESPSLEELGEICDNHSDKHSIESLVLNKKY